MLLTNDRKTTIIQDELVLSSMQSVYWFAHYYLQKGSATSYGVEEVQISADGRTAYLKQYKGINDFKEKVYNTLRLTIVSDNPALKFEIMDAYTFIHNDEKTGTYKKGEVGNEANSTQEHSRSRYNKLAISSGMVLEFRCAVVIEMIDTETIDTLQEIDVGYTFTNMSQWNPSTDMRGHNIEATIERRGTPNVSTHLVWSMGLAERYHETNSAYTSMIREYYRALTDAYYLVRMLGADLPSSYDGYADYLGECREGFAAFRDRVMTVAGNQDEFVKLLMGLK
jgi:hypothetical protein